jgi:hypothetical protein
VSPPAWMAEARTRCPAEAAAVDEINTQLQALANDAPTGDFVDLYERMLEARDRLYEAWISAEMDA